MHEPTNTAAPIALPHSFESLIQEYESDVALAAAANPAHLLHDAGIDLKSLNKRLFTAHAALCELVQREIDNPHVMELTVEYALHSATALDELMPRLLVLLHRAGQGLPPGPFSPNSEAAETASEPEAFTREDLSALTDELRDVEALLQAAAGCDELADARRFAEMAKAKAQHVREVLA